MSRRLNDATPADWDRVRTKYPPRNERADDHKDLVFSKWVDLAMQEAHEGEEEDPVNHPTHYNSGGVECIQAIEASMDLEAFQGYLKGNTLKYIWRMSYKGKALEDCQKAQWYLNKLISTIEDEY